MALRTRQSSAITTPLKLHRVSCGLSSRQLANAVNIDQSQLNRIENGKASASLDLTNRIAKFFNNAVTRDQILFPEDYPADKKLTRATRTAKAA